MPENKVYFSPEGIAHYKRELQLKQERVKGMKGSFEEAAAGESSVWHDNFAHEQSLRDLERFSREARDAVAILGSFEVIEIIEQTTRVNIGNTVKIVFDDDTEKEVTIGAFGESVPEEGMVTYETPLARALIGKQEGDDITVMSPRGNREAHIEKIHPASYRYRQLIAELFGLTEHSPV